MIKVLTSHNKIWSPDQVAVDIIKEYQSTGSATVELNSEGPCAEAVGLYKLLDYVCDTFGFAKNNISIVTGNTEELHPDYKITIEKNYWFKRSYKTSMNWGFTKESFKNQKDPTKNLFGCMYNIPSWNRLCLLAHIKYNTKHTSLLACNGTWEGHCHNSFYLDPVTDFCPSEFSNISRLLIDTVGPLPGHPGHKPDEIENTQILSFYNDFFIDIVAETYTNGLTFFPTEKTFRPMYGLTPFITFGPQGMLSTLKSDYGFQTFDQYWDESYDDYQNYERIQHIYKVIDYIDSKSDSELVSMYNDMSTILEHNHNRLCEIYSKNNAT